MSRSSGKGTWKKGGPEGRCGVGGKPVTHGQLQMVKGGLVEWIEQGHAWDGQRGERGTTWLREGSHDPVQTESTAKVQGTVKALDNIENKALPGESKLSRCAHSCTLDLSPHTGRQTL